jgi:DnaJ-class molecular chaperone
MKVQVFCHTCEGKGSLEDKAYPNGEEIRTICPECNGRKWVWEEAEPKKETTK